AKAEAVWVGVLKGARGTVTLGSGAYRGPSSCQSRFEPGSGTIPEELLAAAHAGCFSMALSHALAQAGHPPKRVHTTAKVHLEKTAAGFAIPRIDLVCDADVPGMDAAAFKEQAEQAKKNCPLSKLLARPAI